MKVKPFRLEEEDEKIIQKVQEEQGLKSEAAALRYILRQYSKNEKTVNGISMEVFRKMEEMQELTLDILNTILIDSRFDVCYPVSEEESEVLIKLKDHRKKKLANLKQKKDYKNKKKGGGFKRRGQKCPLSREEQRGTKLSPKQGRNRGDKIVP